MSEPIKSGSRCTRCGKTRIVLKTSSEVINGTKVFYTETGCSDKDCQKKVDEGLIKEQEKREAIKKEQVKREEQRRKNSKKKMATNAANKKK